MAIKRRQDLLLAHMNAYAVDPEDYAMLLKYAGIATGSRLAKEKLAAIDPETNALLIRFIEKLLAGEIQITDAGDHYISDNVEGALQEAAENQENLMPLILMGL